MNTINTENAILASFLYADDIGFDKADTFELNSKLFTSSYRRAVADKINDETNHDKMYGFLSITLEEHTKNTSYEHEWTDILAQTPYPIAQSKRLHEKLEEAYKERIAKAFR